MNAQEIEKLQTDRLRYLESIYHKSKGDPSAFLGWEEIGTELGFDRKYSLSLLQWLKNEYYIKFVAGGIIQVTNSGIRIIEDAIKHPERLSGSFVVTYNSIHIDQMINSSIQQGTRNSNQKIVIQQNELGKINDLIIQLETLSKALDSGSIQTQDLISNIETVKAQTRSSSPKKSIIVDTFSTIKDILETIQIVRTISPQIFSSITETLRHLMNS